MCSLMMSLCFCDVIVYYTPHASGVGEYVVVGLKIFLILSNDVTRR